MKTMKPNFLIVQADQLTARALACYGNRITKTPNIDKLVDRGTVFENAFCNYPLCGPSRASMMTGLLAFNAGVYDNGTELAATLPTFAHYLRVLGYQTCLAGKMHFIGPDQLHGFDERLTTDIYPSDFNWAANWTAGHAGGLGGNEPARLLAAAGEVNGILRSGVYERTVQLDYDDEVAFKAIRKIHDYARSDDDRPFCLVASFTHPHDPFAVPQEYWDRYRHDDIDLPDIGRLEREELDAHSQRLHNHIGVAEANMSDDDVRIARHGYYAAISYIDDQVGKLLDAVAKAGLTDSTVVIFISDHGEALGERGLWFKRSFYDVAMKVPFIVSAPGQSGAMRHSRNVSLVDLLPTLVDLADPNGGLDTIETRCDGKSLKGAMEGHPIEGPNVILSEMAADALTAPAVAVVDGPYKYIHCETDPPLLFNRADDPLEATNLAGNVGSAEVEARMVGHVERNWRLDEIKQKVLESQRCRRLVERAHSTGLQPSWDYDILIPGRDQYFRASAINPSASNYSSSFDVRLRADSNEPNRRLYP